MPYHGHNISSLEGGARLLKKVFYKGEKMVSAGGFFSFFRPRPPPFLVLGGGWTHPPMGVVVIVSRA